MWDSLLIGFSIAFNVENLLFCFIGCFYGTFVGVLPGFGPTAAIAMLIPVTFGLPTETAIIMLAGLYYGVQYGGSITSILVNIPGETASVVTTFDGYQMAKQGRAGPALGIAAVGSFIAGTIAVIAMTFIANAVANIAIKFGPPEFCSVMILGLTIIVFISFGSIIKAVMMGFLGIMLGSVGYDVVAGGTRLLFGIEYLYDGIPVVPMVMGLFGLSEVLLNVEKTVKLQVFKDVKNVLPSLEDFRRSILPILRGTGIGFFLGLLPGGGAVVSTFASYAVEKKMSKNPEKFGNGAIEGVAGPESANNAGCQAGFIPLLTLGIPITSTFALVFAALMMHGVTPGPLLIVRHPDVFWSVVASMYIGNVILLILNLPLLKMWVKVLEIPYNMLFPLILTFCLVGSLVDNKIGDVFVLIIFGIFGYLMRKFEYENAPLIIAFIITPIFELNFRQSLILSGGSFTIFVTKPISLACLIGVMFLVLLALLPRLRVFRPRLGSDDS